MKDIVYSLNLSRYDAFILRAGVQNELSVMRAKLKHAPKRSRERIIGSLEGTEKALSDLIDSED